MSLEPTTRTLCAHTDGEPSLESSSDAVEPVQHSFQQGQVGTVASVGRPVDDDQVLVGHIANQDADDAEGKVKPCGDLGDGQDLVAEAAMARCSTVSFGSGPRPRWWRPASRSPGRRGWAGSARRSSPPAERVAGPILADRRAGHGDASCGRPVTPARPACCWLPARVGRRGSLTALGGTVGAHGGRAPWSSARRPGVRTSPLRLTSTVIS
jgi:hypothetical protein